MNAKTYTEAELVGIAKRENNKKRSYLVVNRLQGKHVPVSPTRALAMFDVLSEIVGKAYPGERLLLVGFAETATAIGAALAVRLDTDYMQTTREAVDGVEYLYFSETHSHATEQKIIRSDLDVVIHEIDRILFVEDEVTTGNTILNMIDVIQNEYGKNPAFSVASLLNGMNEEALRRYKERNIGIHYLVKTNHERYTEIAEGYRFDGFYHPKKTERSLEYQTVEVPGGINARRLTTGSAYHRACEELWEKIAAFVPENKEQEILVVGTEECMYPAIFVAAQMERNGFFVRSHSTTRSPIAVSGEAEYPLHERYELSSLYDKERVTFLYDIAAYDRVFIVTDAKDKECEGIDSLIHALASKGNTNIILVRWCCVEKLV